jgi:uncharacterized protein YjbJ (UPF0337 family)
MGKAKGNEQMEAGGRIQISKARLQEALRRVNDQLRGVKKELSLTPVSPRGEAK